jgi:hypothetical protein
MFVETAAKKNPAFPLETGATIRVGLQRALCRLRCFAKRVNVPVATHAQTMRVGYNYKRHEAISAVKQSHEIAPTPDDLRVQQPVCQRVGEV